jgi:hypothetical protein
MRLLVVLGILSAYLVWKLAAHPDLIEAPDVVGNQLGGADSEESLFDFAVVAGVLFVFFFYWFKFNTWAGEGDAPPGFRPRPVRHFTTWLRYLGWNTAYGLIMTGAYAAIVFFPDLIYQLVEAYALASTDMNAPLTGVAETRSMLELILGADRHRIHDPASPAAIAPYAVMLVTVVWSGVRPFSDFEQRARLQLQERAAVPTAARNLIDTFDASEDAFNPDRDTVAEVIKQSDGRLGRADFARPGASVPAPWGYGRVEYLYHLLLRYRREPVFSSLSARYAGEFNELERRMLRLRSRVDTRLKEIQLTLHEEGLEQAATPPEGLTESGRDLDRLDANRTSQLRTRYFAEQRAEIEQETEDAWRDMLQLIVCSVLAVGRTPTHRRDLLEAFGLTLRHRIPLQMKAETVTWAVGGTLVVVFVCSVLYFFGQLLIDDPSLPVPQDLAGVVWWSVMACAMHLIGILAGYSVQRALETRRERLQIGKRRPPAASDQVAEAAWAASFGVSLNVLFMALLFSLDPSGGSFETLVDAWWWALVPGVTAFFAAIYTQQEHRYQLFTSLKGRARHEHDRRILVAQGVATGAVALLVFVLINHDDPALLRHGMLLFATYVGLTTTLVGLALGVILREWVRAEANVGGTENRSNRRRHVVNGEWRVADRRLPVRTFTLSDKGAGLRTRAELEVGSRGEIRIPPYPDKQAEVLRQDEDDARIYYVRFIDDAA